MSALVPLLDLLVLFANLAQAPRRQKVGRNDLHTCLRVYRFQGVASLFCAYVFKLPRVPRNLVPSMDATTARLLNA